MQIRAESPDDLDAIHRIESGAFGRPAEADLVDRLRTDGDLVISLVAAEAAEAGIGNSEELLGHIAFSPVTVNGQRQSPDWLGLAPVAVAPAHQGRGIGGRLIEAGLERCRELQAPVIILLGHPTYYPRFGFAPAHTLGLRYSVEVPPEAFMALELEPGAIAATLGSAKEGIMDYAPAFAGVD